MRRLLLFSLLLASCSAGTPSIAFPGKTARQVVVEGAYDSGKRAGLPESQARCVSSYLDRTMSDAEAQRAEASMSNGVQDATYMRTLEGALAYCRQ